jgi:hypothetical protein
VRNAFRLFDTTPIYLKKWGNFSEIKFSYDTNKTVQRFRHHSQADLIWPDGPFNTRKKLDLFLGNFRFRYLKHY